MKPVNGTTKTTAVEPKTCTQVQIAWQVKAKKARGEEILKNIGTASALLVCLVMLRNGALPTSDQWTDTVLTAAVDETLLDEKLGKLSFVSALFPEAVLVFGNSHTASVSPPVEASAAIHTWSAQEPYIAWLSDSTCVFAAINGEVRGVYHGMDEELIVHIANDQHLSCIAGNLRSVNVEVGDQVMQGDLIGWIGEGSFCTFEVQQDGISIDPSQLMEGTCSAS